jgi:hypothetical protein
VHLDATSGAKYRQIVCFEGHSSVSSQSPGGCTQLEMTLLVPIAIRLYVKYGSKRRLFSSPVDAIPFLPTSHAVPYDGMNLRAHVESDVPKMECNLANYPDPEVRTIIAAVGSIEGPRPSSVLSDAGTSWPDPAPKVRFKQRRRASLWQKRAGTRRTRGSQWQASQPPPHLSNASSSHDLFLYSTETASQRHTSLSPRTSAGEQLADR